MKRLYTACRRVFIDILIRLIERDIYNTPVKQLLDDEAKHVLFAELFDRADFRQYLVERETRFVHAQAREWKESVNGQRVENMVLFHKCRVAHEKRQKKILSLRRATEPSTPVAVPSDELVNN